MLESSHKTMHDVHVFVDEYGDTNIRVGTPGVTDFYITTAVIVPDDRVAPLRSRADKIRRKHFQTGEMKSSGVGSNDHRRLKILSDINSLEFTALTLAVKKEELYRESGLAYKRSFFKYLHRLMYRKIWKVYYNVALVCDDYGSREFMDGFAAYLSEHDDPDMYTEHTHCFKNSRDEVLLQVADFLCGSLARAIDRQRPSSQARDIADALAKRSSQIAIWPPTNLPLPELAPEETEHDGRDRLVRSFCLRQANGFIAQHANTNLGASDVIVQVAALEFLLFQAEFVDPSAWVTTDAILAHLQNNPLLERLDKRTFRSKVVAPLRDAGVVIAGNPKGYKIPVCFADVAEYVKHVNLIVLPMLARLRRGHEDMKMASLGTIDILAAAEAGPLRVLTNALADMGKGPFGVIQGGSVEGPGTAGDSC